MRTRGRRTGISRLPRVTRRLGPVAVRGPVRVVAALRLAIGDLGLDQIITAEAGDYVTSRHPPTPFLRRRLDRELPRFGQGLIHAIAATLAGAARVRTGFGTCSKAKAEMRAVQLAHDFWRWRLGPN